MGSFSQNTKPYQSKSILHSQNCIKERKRKKLVKEFESTVKVILCPEKVPTIAMLKTNTS